MDIANGRAAGRPRRLRIRTESCPASVAKATRKGAGDGAAAAAVDRQIPAKTGRPSAATCRRRKARASMLLSGQASTPAKPPLASNCSKHHATCLPACTTTSRSSARPAAAQAGACGNQGGATRASQPPSADKRASAGSSRLISPMLARSTSSSVRLPRGQPPPGNSASSSGWPLGMLASGRLASASPRQTSPRARTSASATGDGMAFMTAWKPLRESGRRRSLRWRNRLRPD